MADLELNHRTIVICQFMRKSIRALPIVVVVWLTMSGTMAQNISRFDSDRFDSLDFESWVCVDSIVRTGTQKVELERTFYSPETLAQLSDLDRKETPDLLLNGGGIGSVSISTVRHLAVTEVSGLDIEWWWGKSRDFYFSIQTNGTGVYKDLRPSGPARALSLFECKKKRLSRKQKQSAKTKLFEFMNQNARRFTE